MRKFYIRYREDLPSTVNDFSALIGFRRLGIETAPYYGFGEIPTDLSEDVGLCGYLGDVWSALGVDVPALDYPQELNYLLGRNIVRTTLSEAKKNIGFIKPLKHKLFTGFVYKHKMSHKIRLAPYDESEEVWLSEIVDFASEYRCFVLEGEVIGVKHYSGDPHLTIDKKILTEAVKRYTESPVAYTIDLGVVGDQTLLIEVNDALAFGVYGLDPVLHAKMLAARWKELWKEYNK